MFQFDGRTYPCDHCDKIFSDPSNLQRHIRAQHHGARSHTCSECGKTFATSSGLKQHQHIHSSVKPFQCEVCLKAYTQFSNLCRHKRMHADCRQQIKCKDCGQSFSTTTSLSKHKRFCEGMLRNTARFSFPSHSATTSPAMNPSNLEPSEKVHRPVEDNAHLLSRAAAAAAVAQVSNAAYLNMYQRPFSLFPQAFSSPGFGMFQQSNAALNAISSSLFGVDKYLNNSYLQRQSMPLPPTELPIHNRRPEESQTVKRESAFDASEGSSDAMDSGSELDVSTSSDIEPDVTDDMSPDDRVMNNSPMPTKADILRKLCERSLQESDGRRRSSDERRSSVERQRSYERHSIKERNPSNERQSPIVKRERERHSSNDKHSSDEHDRTSAKSPSSSTGSVHELPLDLSLSSKSKDTSSDDGNTPRKNHIFGLHDDKNSTITSAITPTERIDEAYDVQHGVPDITQGATPNKKPLHFPYPIPSPAMMDPIYRVNKEKYNTYQDVRALAYSHRFSLPHFASPIANAAAASHMGYYQRPTPQHMKTLPMMKQNDHFSSYNQKMKERYCCKFCGKVFPRSANLTRHLRTHTGEQPYKCKYCERSFSISSNLQRHVRNIHNKEKPFKCPLCDRCFGQQTNLDRHLKKHESEGPNVIDSPPVTPVSNEPQELEEKEESYFDEIRNFIDKTTSSPISPMGYQQHGIGNYSDHSDCKRSHEETDEDDDDDDTDIIEPNSKVARLNNNNEPLNHEQRYVNLKTEFKSDSELDDEDEVVDIDDQDQYSMSNGSMASLAATPLACS